MSECRGCAPDSGRHYPLTCCRVRLLKKMPSDEHRRAWMLHWRARLEQASWADLLEAVARAFPKGRAA